MLCLSQIQDIDRIWWMSILATLMSFTYAFIGLGECIAQAARESATNIFPSNIKRGGGDVKPPEIMENLLHPFVIVIMHGAPTSLGRGPALIPKTFRGPAFGQNITSVLFV